MNPTHIATLEETIQVLESAIAHNTKMGRTVLVHTRQERANRLKDVLKSLKIVKEPK